MQNEFVINWHITEACNYACRFCFARWSKSQKRDLIKDIDASKKMIDRIIYDFENQLSEEWGFDTLRINFAGGEPLIYHDALNEIATYCQSKGVKTSLISNASLLVKHDFPLDRFDMVGISVDSLNSATNLAIGRHDRKQNYLETQYLTEYLTSQKNLDASLVLKINTVVNAENWQEDMNNFIDTVSPQKWKVFKMLPILTDELSITDEEFDFFLSQHQSHAPIMVSENNEEMTASYLMIDPNGRFYSNADTLTSKEYQYSEMINEVGVLPALKQIEFDLQKFRDRY